MNYPVGSIKSMKELEGEIKNGFILYNVWIKFGSSSTVLFDRLKYNGKQGRFIGDQMHLGYRISELDFCIERLKGEINEDGFYFFLNYLHAYAYYIKLIKLHPCPSHFSIFNR